MNEYEKLKLGPSLIQLREAEWLGYLSAFSKSPAPTVEKSWVTGFHKAATEDDFLVSIPVMLRSDKQRPVLPTPGKYKVDFHVEARVGDTYEQVVTETVTKITLTVINQLFRERIKDE